MRDRSVLPDLGISEAWGKASCLDDFITFAIAWESDLEVKRSKAMGWAFRRSPFLLASGVLS